MVEPLTRMLFVETLAREPPPPVRPAPLFDIEVDAGGGDIGEAVPQDPLDQSDHVADVIGRAAEQGRLRQLDIEPRAITFELRNIEIRDLARALDLCARGLLDFV